MVKTFNISSGGILSVTSNIPVGKGLASSSADLVATARALSTAFSLNLKSADISKFIGKIDPSDGVMYSEHSVAYLHKRTKLHKCIGRLPRMHVLAIDEGGIVDTITYNASGKVYDVTEKNKFKDLLSNMVDAIRAANIEIIGQIATESEIINQKHHYKKHLNRIINLNKEFNGLGVVVSHSGTMVGVLFDANDTNLAYKVESVRRNLAKLTGTVYYFSTLL